MFTVKERFFVSGEGWKFREHSMDDLESAYRFACTMAQELDRTYGADHFWTVDIYRENSSYMQLFHGRLG